MSEGVKLNLLGQCLSCLSDDSNYEVVDTVDLELQLLDCGNSLFWDGVFDKIDSEQDFKQFEMCVFLLELPKVVFRAIKSQPDFEYYKDCDFFNIIHVLFSKNEQREPSILVGVDFLKRI